MARRRNENLISFFSFQDIMMSVCGIVILVTLLLVLKLLTQMASDASESPSAVTVEELQEIQEQIESLKQQRREVQDEIAELHQARDSKANSFWVPSQEKIDSMQVQADRIQAEIKELENQLDKASKKTDELQNRPDALIVQEKEKLLEELRHLVELLAKSQNDLSTKLAELKKTVQDLKKENADLDRIIASSESKKVYFTKRKSTDKTPYIIIYDRGGLTVLSFAEQQPRHFGSTSAFLTWSRSKNRSAEYFVLYLRPSRLDECDDFIKSIKNQGFDVGFDLIGEQTEFSLSPNTEPGT